MEFNTRTWQSIHACVEGLSITLTIERLMWAKGCDGSHRKRLSVYKTDYRLFSAQPQWPV